MQDRIVEFLAFCAAKFTDIPLAKPPQNPPPEVCEADSLALAELAAMLACDTQVALAWARDPELSGSTAS